VPFSEAVVNKIFSIDLDSEFLKILSEVVYSVWWRLKILRRIAGQGYG
jgi:hypothetical protein